MKKIITSKNIFNRIKKYNIDINTSEHTLDDILYNLRFLYTGYGVIDLENIPNYSINPETPLYSFFR